METITVSPVIEQAIDQMPSISPIVGKLRELARNLETSPKELVKTIMLDPVVTGKVIRLVNSSFYGLSYQITSLPQAVVLLGVNTVKNMAMSTAILGSAFLKEKSSPLDPQDFWRHSLAVAVASKMLAIKHGVNSKEVEIYFVAGLLHDIGKVLYIKSEPTCYEIALKESRRLEVALNFSELAHFGCSHAEAGGLLASKWRLDPDLMQVIERHHHTRPKGLDNPLLVMVVIANNLCKRAGFGHAGNPVVEELGDELVAKMAFSPDVLEEVESALPKQLERAAEFLNLVNEEE